MNDIEKRNLIIGFISENQGCTKERIVKNLERYLSRKTVFKILAELIGERVITHGKSNPNSRDYKLSVDTENPAVYVPKELEDFEQLFFTLYTNALRKYNKINKTDKYINTHSTELASGSIELVLYPLYIFHDVANIYSMHSIILWPKKIRDKVALKTLYYNVFTKIWEVQVAIINKLLELRPHMVEASEILLNSKFHDRLLVDQWKNYTAKMEQYYEMFNRFGMKEQIEPILDFIWNISFPYREYLYWEPIIHDKNYKYQDGWRNLLEIRRQKK